ncbi:MAG TPA: hypothetical protein VNS88_06945 [Nitrospiraceae bacterium]|nr:hypothetical protein [Nitrospiraceae bacterium]
MHTLLELFKGIMLIGGVLGLVVGVLLLMPTSFWGGKDVPLGYLFLIMLVGDIAIMLCNSLLPLK